MSNILYSFLYNYFTLLLYACQFQIIHQQYTKTVNVHSVTRSQPFLNPKLLLHLPDSIFSFKQKQPHQHQKADAYTDQ